jgi:hypothetical protein
MRIAALGAYHLLLQKHSSRVNRHPRRQNESNVSAIEFWTTKLKRIVHLPTIWSSSRSPIRKALA